MHDVAIIGAGPAGNIAALDLARRGFRVVVFDGRERLGDKLCTGIIGRECFERYRPLPDQVFHAARSATFVSPLGHRYRLAKEETQAYIIDRVSFVASLALRAQEAGARYMVGSRVTGATVSPGHVEVTACWRGRRLQVRAQALMIAAGFNSPVIRMVGLEGPRRGDYMLGCQVEVTAPGLEETEVYLGERVAPGSFAWLVPLDGPRALAGLVSRHRLNGHLEGFVGGLVREGRVRAVVKEPQRWGIPIRPLARTYGSRVLVCGDSAGLAKPTTGGGIYYALLSGELAAQTLAEAFEAGDLSAEYLSRYQERWRGLFGRELTVGYYARLLFEALGDRQLESLLKEVMDSPLRDRLMESRDFSFDWHSGLILKALRHRDLGRLVRSFGPVVTALLSRLSSLWYSGGGR